MTQVKLIAQPLTREAFKPYGDVLEINGAAHFSINAGTIERHHDLAQLNVGDDPQAKVIVSIASTNQTTRLPCRIKLVERHPLGTQVFYPLTAEPMIIVVCEHSNKPQPASLKAFVSDGEQGINFHRNVWHAPLIALNAHERHIIIDRAGPGNNCEEYYFDEDVEITLQPLPLENKISQ